MISQEQKYSLSKAFKEGLEKAESVVILFALKGGEIRRFGVNDVHPLMLMNLVLHKRAVEDAMAAQGKPA